MIRFTVAVSTVLLGSMIVPHVSIGQEPSEAKADAEQVLVEVNGFIDEVVGGQVGLAKGTDDPKAPIAKPMLQSKAFAVPREFYDPGLPKQLYERKMLARVSDALETNFGLSLSDADDALRAQLEIPTGQGVVVVGVKPGSLAEHAGLKTNDVLLSLGDKKARDTSEVREILLGLGKEALQVRLIREGKPNRLSLVGPEHGFPPEAAEYWIGVPVSPVDATLRAHLPSLASDAGLIVNDVVKGSPAEKVAVLKNDILVSMDGKPLKTSDSLIEQIQATKGQPVPLEILRAGKPITVTIAPAKRAHPTVINLPGHPNGQVRYQVVRPNLAIELDPKSAQDHAASMTGPNGRIELNRWSARTFRMDPSYPYQDVRPLASVTPPLASRTSEGHLELLRNREASEVPTARIEAQLKEIMVKLDGITKTLDGLKKPVEK